MNDSPEARQPWKPTKDFYLKDPRSREIREASIIALRAFRTLQEDPTIDEETKVGLSAEIEHANGKLIELGIQPEMHVGERLQTFQNSSVITAEYLGGQLLSMFGYKIVSGKDIKPVIEEFNELENGQQNALVELPKQPPAMLNYMAQKQMITFIRETFDAMKETNIGPDKSH